MGSGASTQSEWTNSFFVNPQLLDGCTYLCGDDSFRTAFIKYIKTGDWEDRIKDMLSLDKLGKNKSQNSSYDFDFRWLGYAMADSAYEEVIAEPTTPKRQMSGRGRSGIASMQSSRSFANGSFNVSSLIESNLSHVQISAIMLSILYPLFASTDDDEPPRRSPTSSPPRKIPRQDSFQLTNPDAARAQKILQTCADLYTDPDLQLVLRNPSWLETSSSTLKNLALGITVSDTSKPGCPIVYANSAFKLMSGYKRAELEGKSLDGLLHGPSTEASQVALIEEAVKTGRTAKVAVTFHTKRQKAFLDLVAVRSSAQYSVAVHFAATKLSREEDLQMVDDLLLLLACIIKAPLHRPADNTSSPDSNPHRAAASRANSGVFGRGISSRYGPSAMSARLFGTSTPNRSASPERLNSRESSGVSTEKEKEKAPSRGQSLRHVSRMLSRPFGNSEKRPTPVVVL